MKLPVDGDQTLRLWQAVTGAVFPEEGHPSSDSVTPLVGMRQISAALGTLSNGVRRSTVSMLPYTPDRDELWQSLPTEFAMLKRGIAMRSLYPAEARHSHPVRTFALSITRQGGRVHAGPVSDLRFVIVDESVALIVEGGGDEHTTRADLIRSKGMVSGLLDQFELVWQQSVNIGDPNVNTRRLSAREEVVLCAIIRGDINKEIATMLDQSNATVERVIKGLFDYHGVGARPELVAEATRQGWTATGFRHWKQGPYSRP